MGPVPSGATADAAALVMPMRSATAVTVGQSAGSSLPMSVSARRLGRARADVAHRLGDRAGWPTRAPRGGSSSVPSWSRSGSGVARRRLVNRSSSVDVGGRVARVGAGAGRGWPCRCRSRVSVTVAAASAASSSAKRSSTGGTQPQDLLAGLDRHTAALVHRDCVEVCDAADGLCADLAEC